MKKLIVCLLLLFIDFAYADDSPVTFDNEQAVTGTFQPTYPCAKYQTYHFYNSKAEQYVRFVFNTHGQSNYLEQDDMIYLSTPITFSVYYGRYFDATDPFNDDPVIIVAQPQTTVTLDTRKGSFFIVVENEICRSKVGPVYFEIKAEKVVPNVKIKGVVKTSEKYNFNDAQINFYKPDGTFVTSTLTGLLAIGTGEYSAYLQPGSYIIEAVGPQGTSVFSGNVPREKASDYSVIKDLTTLNFTLDTKRPLVRTIDRTATTITINGDDFGSPKGYVDVGGYISNTAAIVKSWTGTKIVISKTKAMPNTGCIRVFAKYAGYSSNCVQY